MPAASPTSFDVHYGLAIRRPEPVARIVYESNPGARGGWFEKLMSRNPNSLANRIRRGEVKSAWDGIDDPFGPDHISPQEDSARRESERREANRRQDELNARLAAEREALAFEKLEELDGYGTF